MNHASKIDKAAKLIHEAGNIVVLTGAGVSTESGLPDFRSNGGLWDGMKPEEISHWSAVGKPEFKSFFTKRITDAESHEPNVAHTILAHWEEVGKVKAIVTQNIDGYHQRGGSQNVIEMHGHLRSLKCDECNTVYDISKYTLFDDDECELESAHDYDGQCLGTVRPEVVLFGEQLPPLAWHKANEACKQADLILVLGTSLQVAPFNFLVDDAYEGGAKVIIITQSETPYDFLATVRINDSIGKSLREINRTLTRLDITTS